MTICFVSDYHPTLPRFGGIAVYSHRIARALARRGHQVHIVVARASERSDIEEDGVHIHFRRVRWLPVFGKWLPGLGESMGIRGIVAGLNSRYRFDVVEIPNWEGMGFASTCMPGPPVIVRLHTSLAESIEMAGRKPTRGERFIIWMENASARRAFALVTHSLFHRTRMVAACGRDDIEVIPHGVVIPDQVSAPEGKSVLAVGRMNARKGMDILLEAIPEVLSRVPEAEFRVVGASEDDERVRVFREEHPGLRVEFLGTVAEERLHQLYDECALYVSPALYESFGLTYAEAMAHGRPVVGCAASAVPEIVRDGVDGLLVPPRDARALAGAIATLLSDEEMRRRMGADARQRAVENYSMATAAGRVESYFMSLLKKG